jgi:tetratricopeptide (TPR) repeat protein
MPSHIDIRRGRWQKAIETNARAVEDDRRYRAKLGGKLPGLISFYAAHNQHMLAYAALMTGQSKLAMKYIRAAVSDLPPEFVQQNAVVVESFVALPMEVMVRFGKWDDVLAEPENYPDYMPFTRAFHHAARAIAFAAKGEAESARKEQSIFTERAVSVPKETVIGNNTAELLLPLVTQMIEGEILIAENKVDQGIDQLREALKKEDGLKYDEPPAWMIPIRHSLGANLMKAGQFAEAEEIYREDLKRLPENGWSLYGLAESLRAQKKPEAVITKARFQKSWARADLKISSSCLCRPGA